MTRKLEQLVDDWFLNSPDWPLAAIDVEKEVVAIQRDGTIFNARAIREEIARFARRHAGTMRDERDRLDAEFRASGYRESGSEEADIRARNQS